MLRSQPARRFLKYIYAALLTGNCVFLACACGGGGASAAPTPQPPQANAVPQISSISPSNITTVALGSVVTVTGTGFLSTSSITWNGAPHATTYVSSTELQFTVTASDIATVGSVQISVVNPAPGGGTASPSPISITYPVPVITSLKPASIAAGSAGLTLAINGTGFAPSSTVQYNGVPRPTTYVNASALTVALTANDVVTPATAQITMVTGAPGGGTSAVAILTISQYPVPAITSANPSSVTINSPDTSIDLQGSGFHVSFHGSSKWKRASSKCSL